MTISKITITLLVLALSACAATSQQSLGLVQVERRCPSDTVKVCSEGLEPCGCAQLVDVY